MTAKRGPGSLAGGARAALIALVLWSLVPPVRAQALPEAEVKAAFVYNFAKFAEWPPEATAQGMQHLHVCLIGEKAGLIEASERLNAKPLQGREILIRSVSRPGDLLGCHVAVFGAGDRNSPELLSAAIRMPILTVSDVSGFIEGGGMVQMEVVGGRVVFDVNLATARAARLKLSSQLLRLARRVTGG